MRLGEFLTDPGELDALTAKVREQERSWQAVKVLPCLLKLTVKIEAGEALDEAEQTEYDVYLDQFPEFDGGNVTAERKAEIEEKEQAGGQLSIDDKIATDAVLRLADERERVERHRRDRNQPSIRFEALKACGPAGRRPRRRRTRPTGRHTCRATSRRGPPRDRDDEPELAPGAGW